MQFFKFNLFFFLVITSASAEIFNDMECINSSYDSFVEHKAMPFGLSKTILGVSKKECLITISHEKLKFMKSHWTIDICRGPVHIKKTGGAVEVLKRDNSCAEGSSPFCKELSKIETVLQDDGLIFADGQKESISSEHGKVYCSFLLVKKYLRDGVIFNRGKDYNGVIFKKEPGPSSFGEIPSDDGPGDF